MKRARRGEGFIATLWNYYAPGEKEQRCCRNKDFLHVRSPLALMAAAILPEISLLGEVGSWTLVVGRVARPPFPLSIHFVPNNFATLVVKGWSCFRLGRLRSCFRRGRYRSRGRRWAGRSRRLLCLWGDPSRE